MTCNEAEDRLDDYVDGALAESEFQEMELHIASCAACREQERRLRLILAQAHALPRELTPPRNLWPGVAERIGQSRRMLWQSPLGLAMAAALLAAVAALALRQTGPGPSNPLVTPVTAVSVSVERNSIAAAERDYEKASADLLAALEGRRASFSPETIASVERNLAVIDQALSEVRAALGRDPGNPELTRRLVSTHRKTVDTLRRLVRLSTAL